MKRCFRCRKKANATWKICADGNQKRSICQECDIALNKLVLRWMGFKNWKTMMDKYEGAAE